jgi:hypothetical protein
MKVRRLEAVGKSPPGTNRAHSLASSFRRGDQECGLSKTLGTALKIVRQPGNAFPGRLRGDIAPETHAVSHIC